ncbi:MAG: glycosyltransferase [Acidobacteria bacterium]|nr:glycosyltransferase [Acidobacteriota bacterium]MBI3422904.1 glycosyltransferase [Acidobacteriota bacterium]
MMTELPSAQVEAEFDTQFASARIYPLGGEFLGPFLTPCAHFVGHPEEADIILAFNSVAADAVVKLAEARHFEKPIAWWTIEDPNWFEAFITQARLADYVFTTDEECLPLYRERLGHDRIFWLPLACSPEIHHPLPIAEDATEFVISANWYSNQARRWAVETVVKPLLDIGHTLTLYCYENFMWPDPYRRHWRAHTHYLTTAEQYRHGQVVLGLNNQRRGLDGIAKTVMTSMRTFEALACGKPFLCSRSDAYERLGLIQGEHLVQVGTASECLRWAARLLGSDGDRIARAGREQALKHHTYAHRLTRILEVML